MEKFVSIIVPAHNEQMYIGRCISSLLSQNYPKKSYEIIVIDNQSVDNTAQIAKTLKVKIFSVAGNVGAVRNFGAKVAQGDFLAFIDADCIAPNDWLKTGADLLNSEENSVFGGGCKLDKNANWIEKNWIMSPDNGAVPKQLIGACIFIKKSDFYKVKGFNEKVTSGEDSQLSSDLTSYGFDVILRAELSVIHLGNAKSISSFIRRQIWHSENYLLRIKESLSDITFIIILIFLLLIIVSIISLYIKPIFLAITLPTIFFIPLVFSMKRIKRTRTQIKNPLQLLQIYFLDTLYVLGRSAGLLKGLIHLSRLTQLISRKKKSQ